MRCCVGGRPHIFLREQVVSSVSELSSGLACANVRAKEDRERLDDASRNIEHLGQNAMAAQTSLRRMQVDIEGIQVSTEKHTTFGSKLLDDFRALRHGLEVTDGEVQDMKVYFDIPYSTGGGR